MFFSINMSEVLPMTCPLTTGFSPDTNESSICMWYSRGPHANHTHRQCRRLLCVTVQREQLLSARNAEWCREQKSSALFKHIKQHTTAIHLRRVYIIVVCSLKPYVMFCTQKGCVKGWGYGGETRLGLDITVRDGLSHSGFPLLVKLLFCPSAVGINEPICLTFHYLDP